jgi:ArsR family transcriptional regulator
MTDMGGRRTEAEAVESKAAGLAALLRALANERRLRILCRLMESGEMTVTTLADGVGLSQSALSQHLARMRDEGIVTCRRDGQTIWYRIADRRIEQLYLALDTLFCRAR